MKFISSLLLGAVAVASAQDIVEVAVSNGSFTTLVAAVGAAGLVDTLKSAGPFTVFAPTDDAFAALPVGLLEYLLEPDSKDELTAVLLYHVLAGEVDSAKAIELAGSLVETVGTEEIEISHMGSSLMINDAKVIGADVGASNGVIHVIDKLLVPPSLLPMPSDIYDTAASQEFFKILLAAADETGVTETVLKTPGPYTVFAPTDAAFEKLFASGVSLESLLDDIPLLTNILAYHVLPGRIASDVALTLDGASVETLNDLKVNITVAGETLKINDAEVIFADIFASNGMVHVIDTVLIPPTPSSTNTILDVASSDERFKTLVTALKAAELDGVFESDGPFTVFAPTDDAFAALPVGLLEFLLEPENSDILAYLLAYHAVQGSVNSATAISLSGQSVATLSGENITVSHMGESLMINNAMVIGADVGASNGIIHVIDQVLYPPSFGDAPLNLYDLAASASVFTTLLAAADATGVTESILKEKGPYTILAPTDDAFAKLPDGTVDALLKDLPALTKILAYHVIPGRVYAETILTLETAETLSEIDVTITVDEGMVFVNDAMVTSTDLFASNGLVHIIDTVLLPPSIYDLGVGAGIFTTLLAAVDAANLTDTFKGPGPLTLLAPTDEAFAKLPAGTVDGLLDDIDALTSILLYHVISGDVRAETVVTLESATTLNGADVTIVFEDGVLKINDATVVDTDAVASNGVAHVIDTVLIPPTKTTPTNPTNAPTRASIGANIDAPTVSPSISSGASFGLFSTVSASMVAIGFSMLF